eukprot:287534-Chlamydomonas_euryale.AAC.1
MPAVWSTNKSTGGGSGVFGERDCNVERGCRGGEQERIGGEHARDGRRSEGKDGRQACDG